MKKKKWVTLEELKKTIYYPLSSRMREDENWEFIKATYTISGKYNISRQKKTTTTILTTLLQREDYYCIGW